MVVLLRQSEYMSWQFNLIILFLSLAMGWKLIFGLEQNSVAFTKENYNLNKCASEKQCQHVCGRQTPDLTPSLCDRNGTCVCDCSNKTLVDSEPLPKPCASWIPSMEHEKCSTYCTQDYMRPSKICGEIEPDPQLFCTCLCKWY